MVESFTGKTAIITGAGKGVGRVTALLLAERGAEIVALSRTQSDRDSLTAASAARTVAVDVADPAAARAAMAERAAEVWTDPVKSRPMMVHHPIGRLTEADDVARSIALLLTDDAAMITGAVLPVDGGLLGV